MALLWLEGFEGSGTTSTQMREYLGRRYVLGTSTTYIYNYPGVYHGRCFRVGLNTNTVSKLIEPTTEVVIGFHLMVESAVSRGLISFRNSTPATHAQLQVNSSYQLVVTKGTATVLGTATNPLIPLQWYYVELRIKIHPTEGSYELKVDGVTVLSDTDVDTSQLAPDNEITRVTIGSFSSPFAYYAFYDNIYLLDLTGSEFNNFLGQINVVRTLPNSDFNIEWTRSDGDDSFELINDLYTDDDATYVESSDDGDTDLYEYESLPINWTPIASSVNTEVRDTDEDGLSLITVIDSFESDPAATIVTYTIVDVVTETVPEKLGFKVSA